MSNQEQYDQFQAGLKEIRTLMKEDGDAVSEKGMSLGKRMSDIAIKGMEKGWSKKKARRKVAQLMWRNGLTIEQGEVLLLSYLATRQLTEKGQP